MAKPHLRFIPTLGFGSAALVAALVACDPVPSYPVPEQPVVGLIFNEQSGVVTADGQPIVLHTTQADLSVPAGAYPVGTRVTLRLVGDLRLQPEAGWGYLNDPIQAMQILPAQPVPAMDLPVVLHYGPGSRDFAIFHAVEGDSVWTSTGMIAHPTIMDLAFSANAPGLWMAFSVSSASTGGSPDGGRD